MNTPLSFEPGAIWLDTDGVPIQAHGGGLLFDGNLFYWYGENKSAPNRAGTVHADVVGVNCYSSPDLLAWKNEGVVLPAVSDDIEHDLHLSGVLERPKVLFNAQTGQYVMWMHIDKKGYRYARTGVAVSDSPTGPFTYRGSFRPNGQESRDMTVWQDEDGAAYLIYSSQGNATLHITRLTKDYLHTESDYIRVFEGQYREAPAVWKHAGQYFMITSGCTGWSCNAAAYAVADAMLGDWQLVGSPCVGTEEHCATTFGAQSTFVLPLPQSDRFIFLADRWNAQDLRDSRYVWLPLRMRDGAVFIEWRDKWNPEDKN